jgi:c-di-GMP-binding flagellar brake protein YcgR
MEKHKGKVHEVSEQELKNKLQGGGGDDRRGTDRVPARLQVEVPLANIEQLRSVYTTNISKGGMLFTLTSPASIPAAVDLTLTLPDGKKVTLQSEVRHVARREGTTEFDVGVQFQELDPPTRLAFEEALAALPAR